MNKNILTSLGLGFTILGLTIFRDTNWPKIICLFLGVVLTVTSLIIRLKSKK